MPLALGRGRGEVTFGRELINFPLLTMVFFIEGNLG